MHFINITKVEFLFMNSIYEYEIEQYYFTSFSKIEQYTRYTAQDILLNKHDKHLP